MIDQTAPAALASSRRWHWFAAGGISLALWIALLVPTYNRVLVYTWDSAAYIDCARSILEGRGFMQRTIENLGPDIWEPISWWPPGYPLLVAAAASLGIDLPFAGVVVAAVAAALAILLLSRLALRLLPWMLALPLVLTIVLTPGFLLISATCMSDSSYYAIVVASALCLLRGSQGTTPLKRWFLAAGLLAGLSWGVRNVSLSLLAVSGAFLVVDAWWNRRASVLLAWGIGAALGVMPFVIRNFVAFGALNGYNMPPSDLNVWQNISATVAVIVRDLTGSDRLSPWLLNGRFVAAALAMLTLAAVAAVGIGKRASWREFLSRHHVILFCVTWAALHLAIVIAARTTYRWGEPVVTRHTMQTYWLLWIALALALPLVLCRFRLGLRTAHYATAAVFALVAGRQLQEQFNYLRQTPKHSHASIDRQFGDAVTAYLSENVGSDQIVLAHDSDLLRMHGNINSRKIPSVAQYYKLEKLTRDNLRELGDRGFLWGLVVTDHEGVDAGAYDHLIRDIVNRPDDYPEFTQVPLPGPAVVLKYTGSGG